MTYKYSVFLPTIKGNIEEEWKQCLKQILKVRDSGYSAVRLTIFTDSNDLETYVSDRQFILDSVIYEFSNETPAATGVGVRYGGVILDFCAIEIGESTNIEPVDNPDQINAYSYGQNVLMGFGDKRKTIKHPPQFERGILLVNDSYSALLISGTASIRGQETIGKEDIEKQTILTIENIKKVSDSAKISKLVSGTPVCKEKFYRLRIYIKRQKDFKIVRMICDRYFQGIPAVYVEADICRDDLLIEIEAESLFDCTE